MKLQGATKMAGILPSMLVSLVHFRLSILVAPSANVAFQHTFDTGERATGADAVIVAVDRFLSVPIPAIFFASHPVHGLTNGWWIVTGLNSVFWGLFIYACYTFSTWALNRYAEPLSK